MQKSAKNVYFEGFLCAGVQIMGLCYNRSMNILYCGDAGIREGVTVSVLSLVMRTPRECIYNIYIATVEGAGVRPFPAEAVGVLDKLVKQYNPRSFVRRIDATEVFEAEPPTRNMKTYFTPCSMLRLYADRMPELESCERILYLDYDVVCRGDIRELYETPLAEAEAAGVLDQYGKHFYHYHGLLERDYMNSGVMLINLDKCRKTGMMRRAVELCARRWMMLADQAALNKAITQRVILPRKYNEQGERPREDTVLHHFSNNFKWWPVFHVQKVKPHEVERVHEVLGIYEYDDIYAEYEKWRREV